MMYGIFILLFAVLAKMAKKGRGGRRGPNWNRYVRGNLDIDIALGTLAGKTGLFGASDTVVDRMRISSIKAVYSLSNVTVLGNAGPVLVLVAHSDYTLAEVEQFIELGTSWSEADQIDKEIQSRKIRRIGVLDIVTSTGGAAALNDGKPITTKLNWTVTNGLGLNFVAYNMGTGAFATTDPNVNINGHANLWMA